MIEARTVTPPRSAGIVVVRRSDAGDWLCLLLRAFRDWDFPKGGIDAGESPLAAAIRETAEEASIASLAFRLEKCLLRHHPVQRRQGRTLFHRADLVGVSQAGDQSGVGAARTSRVSMGDARAGEKPGATQASSGHRLGEHAARRKELTSGLVSTPDEPRAGDQQPAEQGEQPVRQCRDRRS